MSSWLNRIGLYPDIGSNGIHVTPLQYSVTFLVLLAVFNYNFAEVILERYKYSFGKKTCNSNQLQFEVIGIYSFKLSKYYDYFNYFDNF